MGSHNSKTEIIWFDENISNKENQGYLKRLNSISICKGYRSLDEGFNNFYSKEKGNEFKIIFVIISGRFFSRYMQKLKENINKIINIPYTFIFTSSYFRKIVLQQTPDKDHILSYDLLISIKDGFYNPGGIYDNFDELFNEIKKTESGSKMNIRKRLTEKLNNEGLLTFAYLRSEEELIALALYKDIITNEAIDEKDCQSFHNYILSFNNEELNALIKNLNLFRYIPFEILSKYWVRFYTIESDFYKVLNNDLMKSKMTGDYKTFIKMMYIGVETNSLKSYQGKFLYRGSCINKSEIKKIKEYSEKSKLSTVAVISRAFLSFSEDEAKAKLFCGNSDETKIGCLYILDNNNSNLYKSNAKIQNFSVFPAEKEILFFPGSSFIITNVKDISDNKIEIFLNYNGKFKEKYSYLFEDQEKLNELIKNNTLTKNIAGEKLKFLKEGKYLIKKTIERQVFGYIYKGKDLKNNQKVIIKEINKDPLKKKLFQNNFSEEKSDEEMKEIIESQVEILKEMSEKNIHSIKYKDYFETEDSYYIIEDYYDMNLDKFLEKKYNYKLHDHRRVREPLLPLNVIKKIFKQLNVTFKELLKNHIVHRDIRPINIYIKFTDKEKTNFDVCLGGYEMSEKYKGYIEVYCGYPPFMAPEIMKNERYHNNCDLYSIGVTLYYLYWGEYPYKGVTSEAILHNIKSLKQIIFKKIEEDSQFDDLIRKLLREYPDERITWEDYFEHPFFKQYEY